MKRGRRTIVPPLGLLAVWAGAGLALWLFWPKPLAAPLIPSPNAAPFPTPFEGAPQSEAASLVPAFAGLSDRDPAADAALFAARPLLSETRRVPERVEAPAPAPLAEASPLAPAPAPSAPALRLQGVLVAEGRQRALFLDLETGQALWLAPGEAVKGWELKKVLQSGAILSREGAETTIQLFENPLP